MISTLQYLYMFTNGIVISTICMVILHLYRKKPNIHGHKYAKYIMASFIVCTLRLIIPYESPIGGNIYLGYWCTPFILKLWKSIKIFNANVYVFHIIIAAWLTVAFIKCISVIKKYRDALMNVRLLYKESGVDPKDFAPEMDLKNIRLIISPKISMPFSIAFIKKYIILPQTDYTNTELRCILSHEMTHIKNRDSLIRLAIHLLCSIYWWIPFKGIIKKDIEDLIEIRCDERIVSNMSVEEKINYLQTMANVVKNSNRNNNLEYAAAFTTGSKRLIQERAEEIVNTSSPNRLSRIIPIITTALIIFSYVISVKPYMDIPADYFDDEYGYVFSPENTTLYVNDEGIYELKRYDGIKMTIGQKEANEWLKDSKFQQAPLKGNSEVDSIKKAIKFIAIF